jgi:hypothetical protein
VAPQLQPVFWDGQCEIVRHPDYIEYLKRCPSCREITDHAVDLVATVINLRGLSNTVARCNSSFDHNRTLRLKKRFIIGQTPDGRVLILKLDL